MNGLDWNLLRSFVAVSEEGSLSAAARKLGLSQPTMGRHIAELEDGVGTSLFARHPRGLTLTERGTALYEAAREVRDGVDSFARRAAGLGRSLDGTVRLSASEVVASFVLPRLLVDIRRRWPAIELEIVADNSPANLLRRDADVAVRMFRPEQPDLVARKAADAQMGLYASPDYLAASQGPPRGLEDLRRHTFVGMDRNDVDLRLLQRMGVELRRGDFMVRSDCQTLHVEAARAGLGIAGIQRALAERLGGLVRVFEELPLPPLPVWLVAHEDVRRSARVRAVFDALATGLKDFYAPGPAEAAQEGRARGSGIDVA
jgi:DNA-binding transcriptional LysR family regulator